MAELIGDLLGHPARRKLGAGRLDDIGDIDGVPDMTVQVVNWPHDTIRAMRDKPIECADQQARARTPLAATFVRLRGGVYRVVLTPEQWADYVRAVRPPS